MTNTMGRMKRTIALVMSLALILVELVVPMAALAGEVTSLPALIISYTDAFGVTGMTFAFPAEGDEGILYWAQLDQPVSFPLQISVMVDGDASCYELIMTGLSSDGVLYEVVQDTTEVIMESAVAIMNVYSDAEHTDFLGACPVYLSTIAMPTTAPTNEPTPPQEDDPTEPPAPPADEPTDPPAPEVPSGPEAFGNYTPLGDIPGYIASDSGKNINIRQTPNQDYEPIGKVPFQGEVILHGVLDIGWHYITYNGVTGYMSSKYVYEGYPPADEPTDAPTDAPTEPPAPEVPSGPEAFGNYTPLGDIPGYIAADNGKNVNIRQTPNQDYDPIGKVPFQGEVILHGVLDIGWHYITYNGVTGYMSSKYVYEGYPPADEPTDAPTDAPTVAPTEPPAPEVPSGPEAFGNYTPLGDIPGYITTGNKKPVNFRKTPNKDYDPIGTIPHEGDIIIHGKLDSGWYYIQYNGLDGYVSGDYVNEGLKAPTTADVTFSYVDESGNPLLDNATKTYENGTYTDFSDMIPAVDGYEVKSVSTDLLNIVDGVASPAFITVTYGEIYVAPATADVTFSYVDESGNPLLDNATKTYENGSYTDFSDMIPAVDGYEVKSVSTDLLSIVDGVASPAFITVTYGEIYVAPTTADVTFSYVDESGATLLDNATKTYENGSYTDFSDMIPAVDGYEVKSVSTDLLSIVDGVASPAFITVTYGEIYVAPTTADVTFSYVDESGNPLRDNATKTYENGSYTDFSDMIPAVDGYEVKSVSTDLLSIVDGVASPAFITVTYGEIYVAPTSADVTFVYVDESGAELRTSATKTFENGIYNDFTDMIPVIDGYDLAMISPETVVIENGVADYPTVTITYRETVVIPTSADVTFVYVDESGAEIRTSATKTYENGTYTDLSDMVPVIDGYDLKTVSTDSVVVENGVADPATVTVTYAIIPGSAEVTFSFVDESGASLLEDSVKVYQNGTYTNFSNAIPAVPGYDFQSLSTELLTVDRGVATPASITVTYKKHISALLNVRYVVDGVEFLSEQIVMEVGSRTFAPDESLIPEGYTPVSADPVTVTLSADGTLSQSEVVFSYEKVVPPTSADVPFRFVDEKGKVIKELVITLEEGEYSDLSEYITEFDGYTFKSASATGVIVQAGVAVPDQVTFTYEKNTTAMLEVRYVDPIGQVLSTETLPLKPGKHQISPNPSVIPEGYKLSPSGNTIPATVVVESGNKLVAKPNMIEFHLVSTSVYAEITVNYLTTTGQVLYTTKLELEPGTHTLLPDASLLPEGYEIITSPAQKHQITVQDSGVSSQLVANFYCKETVSEVYVGYAVTTDKTALRNAYNQKDQSIITTLPQGTLVFVNGQVTVSDVLWSSAQTVLGTYVSGAVLDSNLRRISDQEAAQLIEQWKKDNPTPTPTHSPEPSLSGYYMTTTSNIVMRSQPSVYASYTQLPLNGVVYITGEGTMNGTKWYTINYDGKAGYIRGDQAKMLRKMTNAQVDNFLGGSTPAPSVSASPYDPYGASSYGYVTSSSVNFRESPSTSGRRIKVLYKYGFGLIISTREVNGATWYQINQNGITGWVHGNYFRQLNMTELNSFLVSDEYKQGLSANSNGGVAPGGSGSSGSSSGSSGSSSGSATPGNIASVEDWNVGAWQNSGVASPSYQPFNPYATATPAPTLAPDEELEAGDYTTTTLIRLYESTSKSSTITPVSANAQVTIKEKLTANNAEWYVVSYNGKQLYMEAQTADNLEAAAAAPTASIEPIFTMIPIDYEPEEVSTSSAPWGLIAGAVILLGGAGGVYAYALNQNKKRKAAARRGSAARKPSGAPQTRRAVSAPTVTGNNPYGTQQTSGGNWNPYGTGSQPSSWDSSAPGSGDNATSSFGSDFSGSFAPPSESAGTFAPPASSSFGTEGDSSATNPFAPPADFSPSGAAQRSNPFARPVEPTDGANGEPRRRSTRQDRFGSDDGSFGG